MSTASEGKTAQNDKDLREIRHRLHRLAERSGSEHRTAEYIEELLKDSKPDELHRRIGGNGIIAVYRGKSEGPTLMFRAELDALPIREGSGLSWSSDDPETSHRCGHDGHMATLIGMSRILKDMRPEQGAVWLLFQPAEETGQGAGWMLGDEFFSKRRPDLVFAYHNLPGYPKHRIIVNEGVFTATVRSLILRFRGSTAHAGQPEQGKNPAYAIAGMVDACAEWNRRKRKSYVNVVPIHIDLGSPAYGTAPGHGALHLSFRSTDPELVDQLSEEITGMGELFAAKDDLQLEKEWVQPFDSCVNSAEAVELIRNAADALSLETEEREEPYRWGEDFGKFTQAFEGALCCIGAGEEHAVLHSPDYDFPDELLETGIGLFRRIIDQKLKLS